MKALLSVYDKTGIIPLAQGLMDAGYAILSSGGTYRHLQAADIAVTEVASVTGFPEMLDGRVKTLHPVIHGGILARRDHPADLAALEEHDIEPIDLVCVNLYPFEEGLKRQVNQADQVELIDIGGPTMLRSAAKNYPSVIVLSEPAQYDDFLLRLKQGELDDAYRRALAAKVFDLMASYDRMVATYMLGEAQAFLPGYELVMELRYGENPHQQAAFYRDLGQSGYMSNFELLAGKPLSYSNLADVDAAYGVVLEFDEPCVCAVKHNTPCGVALATDIARAYTKAYAADATSIFGGVIACNRPVDAATAVQMIEIFLEVVVAPAFSDEALYILKKKPNLRLVKINGEANQARLMKSINGGVLVQTPDVGFAKDWETVTTSRPSDEERADLAFAMKVAKHVRSNAIVIARDGQTLGIGGGQTNRIDAARLALRTASPGAVLASDGFFPFDDVVREAAAAGVRAILQPGGSIHDRQSISACDELGVAMVLTGRRHFRH